MLTLHVFRTFPCPSTSNVRHYLCLMQPAATASTLPLVAKRKGNWRRRWAQPHKCWAVSCGLGDADKLIIGGHFWPSRRNIVIISQSIVYGGLIQGQVPRSNDSCDQPQRYNCSFKMSGSAVQGAVALIWVISRSCKCVPSDPLMCRASGLQYWQQTGLDQTHPGGYPGADCPPARSSEGAHPHPQNRHSQTQRQTVSLRLHFSFSSVIYSR